MNLQNLLTITILSTAFSVASGCQSLHFHDTTPAIPAESPKSQGGLLLKTGSIQLGPGLGENSYGWVGGSQGSLLH